MKVSLLLLSALAAFSVAAAEEPLAFKTPKDKISYSLDMNPDALGAGLKATVLGGKALLTEAEYEQAMKDFNAERQAKMQAKRAEMQAKQAEQAKEAGDKNKKDG